MLAEIITFVGIVCAGVLTEGEAGKRSNGNTMIGGKVSVTAKIYWSIMCPRDCSRGWSTQC